MKNKFVITITDIKGAKQYTLNQIIKKFALYFVLFIIALLSFGVIFILYLSNEIEDLQTKKEEITQKLLTEKSTLQKEIDRQTIYFKSIQEKIGEVEVLLGVRDANEEVAENFDERVGNITISAMQRTILLQLIPNGKVIESNGVSAKFGSRMHPINNTKEVHSGVDLKADKGTHVYAPAHGIVEFNGKQNGFGNLVIVNHGLGFKTYYAHLNDEKIVKYGQFVSKGEHIANSGNSGLSTGPHLHYEVRFLGKSLDPANFIGWDSLNFSDIFEKEKKVPWASLIKETIAMINKLQNLQ